VQYHGATVAGAILANGSITPLQALNLLQQLELPAGDSPLYFHLLAEVLKLAWRDRLAYLGDDAPAAARLLDPAYAAGRAEALRQFPHQLDRLKPDAVPEGPTGTRHVAAADAAGNIVSMTITQGGPFGSLVTVPGTGLVLGHGMCRFDPRPGRPNSVAPGKRPFNNTCPMVVGDGRRWVGLGLPGGRTIVSITTRAVQALVDRELPIAEMAALPRLHCEASEPLQLERTVPEATIEALRAMGHTVKRQNVIGGPLCAVEWRAGTGETVAGCNFPAVAGATEQP
jgi:gamma-glutamyltranspeptidase/glutathione hydrolase